MDLLLKLDQASPNVTTHSHSGSTTAFRFRLALQSADDDDDFRFVLSRLSSSLSPSSSSQSSSSSWPQVSQPPLSVSFSRATISCQPATSHVQTPADYPAEISSAYRGIHLSRIKSNLRPNSRRGFLSELKGSSTKKISIA